MSNSRVSQLRDLQSIIEEISRAIMWVNEREEEELMFDWGDKNIDNYIPRKQENYSVSITPTLLQPDAVIRLNPCCVGEKLMLASFFPLVLT